MTGAYAKECKAETTACKADAACADLAKCSYDNCVLDKAGGCCTRECAKTLNTPAASQTKFYAMDNCIYCKTCTALCDVDFDPMAYCAVIATGGESMCPP